MMLMMTETTDIDLLGTHTLEGYSDESYALTYQRLIEFVHNEYSPTVIITLLNIVSVPKVLHGTNKAKYTFKVSFNDSN